MDFKSVKRRMKVLDIEDSWKNLRRSGFPDGTIKNPPANAGDTEDMDSCLPDMDSCLHRIPWMVEPDGLQSMGV